MIRSIKMINSVFLGVVLVAPILYYINMNRKKRNDSCSCEKKNSSRSSPNDNASSSKSSTINGNDNDDIYVTMSSPKSSPKDLYCSNDLYCSMSQPIYARPKSPPKLVTSLPLLPPLLPLLPSPQLPPPLPPPPREILSPSSSGKRFIINVDGLVGVGKTTFINTKLIPFLQEFNVNFVNVQQNYVFGNQYMSLENLFRSKNVKDRFIFQMESANLHHATLKEIVNTNIDNLIIIEETTINSGYNTYFNKKKLNGRFDRGKKKPSVVIDETLQLLYADYEPDINLIIFKDVHEILNQIKKRNSAGEINYYTKKKLKSIKTRFDEYINHIPDDKKIAVQSSDDDNWKLQLNQVIFKNLY